MTTEMEITHDDWRRLEEAERAGYLMATFQSSPAVYLLWSEFCRMHNIPYVSSTMLEDRQYGIAVVGDGKFLDVLQKYGTPVKQDGGYTITVSNVYSALLLADVLQVLYSEDYGVMKLLERAFGASDV